MYLSINTDLLIDKVYLVETAIGSVNAKLISLAGSRFNNNQDAISINFETESGEYFNVSDISKISNV